MAERNSSKPSKNRASYERTIRARVRIATFSAWTRAGGIQMVWLIVLIAGAAVPLTEALIENGWEWVSPVLGFVIVVAAGLERIFSRTTPAAVALDRLRRSLSREQRLLLAGGDTYRDSADPFATYVERSEELLAQYDAAMIDYNSQVLHSSA